MHNETIDKNDWRYIEFLTPFTTEKAYETSSKDIIIKGKAINATTTRNGNTYAAEELRKSANTLSNRPILVDHINSVDKIAGKVLKAYYDEANQAVMFEGIIKEAKYKSMIVDGLIENVSVGAIVQEVEEVSTEEGLTSIMLKGIEFVEISLVAIPADPNAGFSSALREALVKKEKQIQSTVKTEEKPMEENKTEVKADPVLEALSKISETVSVLAEKVTKLESKPVEAPVIAPEPVNETKGVVSEELEEITDNKTPLLKRESGQWTMSYDTYEGTKFKRLQRSHI